ncbi:PREDICTED: uncharacterized protein LOC109237475 [Nicotiana attenuata]|uniref:uncharacterized protein LOC109237475 n=1 Tax=Nicotiana attenuata TaxID=49451 RepID=UPI000904609C|nr:PREDICTED: uncharacterized protein LOC109237475 [Nicotiana attenuata]
MTPIAHATTSTDSVTTPLIPAMTSLAQSGGSWADRVEAEIMETRATSQVQLNPKTSLWSKIVGTVPNDEGLNLNCEELAGENVKISMDDIKDEIIYWKTAVICYVLGSNPPLNVIDGYFRRIWEGLRIDKIAQVNRGIFLIRFHTIERRIKVIEEGVQMFDKKPVVVKPWEPEVDVSKEKVDRIPVWIRLKGSDIKYWGKNALTKISGMVGKPLKVDRATTNKERLAFARVLVEMSINQQYPKQVMFENEVGKIVKQEVYYEWKPTLCSNCKNFGHDLQDCRKLHKEEAETRRKQIEQGKQTTEEPNQNKMHNKGENKASDKRIEKQQNDPKTIPTRNTFEVLDKGGSAEELRQSKPSTSCPEGELGVMGPGRGRGGGKPLPNG